MIITVTIFGWLILFSDEYRQLLKHILRSSYFVINFTLLKESGDYFDNISDTKPLLHLWSLAIEEQFYIIWPILLCWAWKKKFDPFKITIFITIASFSLCLFNTYTNKSAAFYLPQNRFWELLAGSILAYIKIYKQHFIVSIAAHFNVRLNKIRFKTT